MEKEGQRKQKKKKNLWERRGMVMCVREMVQLMVPVRAIPTVRCSEKVKYCTKVKG